MSRRAGSERWMAAGLTLAAAAIRIPTLGLQSFWLDEGYTMRLLRMSLGSMLHAIPRTESTPPVYYVFAWVWVRVLGSGEFGVRSLSALAGILTVPVVYALTRRLAGARAAAVAALLVVVSPLLVWFSQEARAYALATLLTALSLWCLVVWLQEGRRRWALGWAVSAAAAIATHYFAAFVVAGELVCLWGASVAAARPPARDRAMASAGVVVVGLALVPLALAQRGTGHADYIAQGSLSTRVAQVPKQLLVGYASPHQLITGVLAALLVLAGALWPLAVDPEVRRRALLPLAVGVGAVVVPIALAGIGIDFLDTRNLLPALPVLLVAAAAGLASGSGRAAARGLVCTGVLAVISLAVVVAVDTNQRYQRLDWRGAEQALGRSTGPRAIVVDPGSGVIPLQIYLAHLQTFTGVARVREIDVIAMGAQVTGGGIGTPPRPVGPLPVPAGFRLVAADAAETFTTLRYASSVPEPVTPGSLAGVRLGGGAPLALLQSEGAGPVG